MYSLRPKVRNWFHIIVIIYSEKIEIPMNRFIHSNEEWNYISKKKKTKENKTVNSSEIQWNIKYDSVGIETLSLFVVALDRSSPDEYRQRKKNSTRITWVNRTIFSASHQNMRKIRYNRKEIFIIFYGYRLCCWCFFFLG